ncbi:MAG: AbiH family protein [Anaerotignum sp.]|nr:AbiH family protein [Anaerotignum sp.]
MTKKEVYLLNCIDCGTPFFTEGEKLFYESHHLCMPKRCKKCRTNKKRESKGKQTDETDKDWFLKENLEIDQLLQTLPYRQVTKEEIVVDTPKHTLYVIGNGFDLMHGIPSSYYSFRDFLGKHSSLRSALENWNMKGNLWADFEDSLAHMDDTSMLNTIPDMMDILGVLDEDDADFSAANYFIAAEMAIEPLGTIERELPIKFKSWINTLKVSETFKPLTTLLNNESYFLNFNYTEFLETLYDVKKENVLYIHGDRRVKNKNLILGHAPGAEFDPLYDYNAKEPAPHNQTEFDLYETTNTYISHYYDATEKKSPEIIRQNQDYFKNLSDIRKIITVGHSLSVVDYPYFLEIKHYASKTPTWILGWHSSGDLRRINAFVKTMGLDSRDVLLYK